MELLPLHIESSSCYPNASSTTVTINRNLASTYFGAWPNVGTSSGNTSDCHVLLSAGTYTLTTIYSKGTNRGIIEAKLDNVSLGTEDAYNSSTTYNHIWTISNFVVTGSGIKTLRYTSTTKNASSSAYGVFLQYWCIQRTDIGPTVGTLEYAAKHIDILGCAPWEASVGAFAHPTPPSTPGTVSNSTDPQDGDSLSYYVPLAAGTWKITITYAKGTSFGRFDVTLGQTLLENQFDMYSNVNAENQKVSWSNISVAADGIYEFKLTCDGKNSSSTNYALSLKWVALQQTA